jgi:hypothetical protein
MSDDNEIRKVTYNGEVVLRVDGYEGSDDKEVVVRLGNAPDLDPTDCIVVATRALRDWLEHNGINVMAESSRYTQQDDQDMLFNN